MPALDSILKKIVFNAEKILVCLVSILILLNVFSVFSRSFVVVFVYFFFCAAGILVIFLSGKHIFEGNATRRVLTVMLIAALIRLIVIYFLGLTSQGDYGVYLSVAKKIKNSNLDNHLYFGIFPHALNYPIFISFFYKIIGEATWLPRVINLLFGTVEAGLAAYVMEKCTNQRIGMIGGLSVALNPSIIFFTLLSGGEPIYSSLILCSVFFLSLAFSKEKPRVFIIVSGAICAIADFFRPTGIILVIAAAVVFFFYRSLKIKDRILYSLSFILPFIVIVSVSSLLTSSVSGYRKPSRSYGWNLFIGANEVSRGTWNEKDAEIFNAIREDYREPSRVQEYFAELGFNRYKKMGIRMVPHFMKKLKVWFDETYVPRVVTQWQTEYTRFRSDDLQQTFFLLTNTYNLFVVIGAIIALIGLSFDKKPPDIMKTMSLYMLGSILLFMVLETATRYKGAYYSLLTMLSVYGYWKLYGLVKSKIRTALAEHL